MKGDILVVFGSASDENVFKPLLQGIAQKGLLARLRICSAHRTPKHLEEIVSNTPAKVIIAGAGLSAALPGVTAAQTLIPVVGIPIANNYEGLDALLSVHQMPPGIPVLGVGVNQWKQALDATQKALEKHSAIKIIKNFEEKKLEKKLVGLIKLLKELGAPFEVVTGNDMSHANEIVIRFVDLMQPVQTAENQKGFVIHVPINANHSASDALQLLTQTNQGVWVGLHRFENAGLAAVALLALSDSKYTAELRAYRQKMADKVVAADQVTSQK